MPVRTERRGPVGLVVLDRPDKRNAMDEEMTSALSAALDAADDDPEVRVVVLAATGTVFSAGSDMASGSGRPTARGGPYGIVRRERSTPVVVAVEGPALGGGFEIVLACDLVVASTAATFGLPEVKRGVVAVCGGLFRGPRALPLTIATELVLTGDPITADEARSHGLVNRLVTPGTAVDAALELARSIAQNSPSAVSESLKALRLVTGSTDGLGWIATETAKQISRASPDATEGQRAFLERRPPRWS